MALNPKSLAQRAAARAIEKSVQVADVATKYWFYPALEPLTSPTLIMIHGYRGNHHGLEAQAGALTGINLVIPDLPGFGESSPFSKEHTVANYSIWLADFIRALKLEQRPFLLGHSFGSLIVSHHVANFDDVSALILQNPVSAPALEGPKAFLTAVSKSFFALAEKLSPKLGEWLLKSWPMVRGMSILMTKSRDRSLRTWVHRQHDANFNDFATRDVAIQGYRASISACVGDFAAGISIPTLILAGERDDITSVEQQRQMVALIPHQNWRLRVIEKVGHLSHYETPEIVSDEIKNFVKKIATDSRIG